MHDTVIISGPYLWVQYPYSVIAVTSQVNDNGGLGASMVVEGCSGHNPVAFLAHCKQSKKFCFWQAWFAEGIQLNYPREC